MLLLQFEGLTEEVRKAVGVYLACHPRPMHELLNPNLLDIEEIFKKQFDGMTNEPIELQTLLDTRETLIARINEELTDKERQFLLSINQMTPDWTLLNIDNLEYLPAIQWKLHNLEIMSKDKHHEYNENLKKVLKL